MRQEVEPGSLESPVPFDGPAINDYFRSYRSAMESGHPDRGALQEHLRRVLPLQTYEFTGRCSVARRAGEEIHNNRWIIRYDPLCLDREVRDWMNVAILAEDGVFLKKFLREAGAGREFRMVARLLDRGVNARGVYSVWEVFRAEFRNPFLAYLQKQFPELTEPGLTDPATVSLSLSGLLPVAIQESRDPDRSGVYGLELILHRGEFYHFDRRCPLRLKKKVEKDPVVGQWEVDATIQCIQGESLSEVVLRLPDSVFRMYPELPIREGSLFTASLKFRRIVKSGDQFYLEWDTIKDIGDPQAP